MSWPPWSRQGNADVHHALVGEDPEVNLGHKISLKDIFAAVGWFLPTAILLAIILILFPDIATFLPNLMSPSPAS